MPALLLLTDSVISGVFDRIGYLAPFLLLLGAGFGLPVPEEVTMVGSGFLLYQGQVSFPAIFATCYVATLLGDSVPFWLGRHFGMSALRFPIVRRIVHPERMALLERRFERHGSWAVFTCRFLPAVRMPGWFLAGTLRMSYPRFLACNGAAALIMTPLWILIGKAFGERIATLERSVKGLNQILGFIVFALVLSLVVHGMVARREKQLARLGTRDPERSDAAARDETPPEAPPSAPSAEPAKELPMPPEDPSGGSLRS